VKSIILRIKSSIKNENLRGIFCNAAEESMIIGEVLGRGVELNFIVSKY